MATDTREIIDYTEAYRNAYNAYATIRVEARGRILLGLFREESEISDYCLKDAVLSRDAESDDDEAFVNIYADEWHYFDAEDFDIDAVNNGASLFDVFEVF